MPFEYRRGVKERRGNGQTSAKPIKPERVRRRADHTPPRVNAFDYPKCGHDVGQYAATTCAVGEEAAVGGGRAANLDGL